MIIPPLPHTTSTAENEIWKALKELELSYDINFPIIQIWILYNTRDVIQNDDVTLSHIILLFASITRRQETPHIARTLQPSIQSITQSITAKPHLQPIKMLRTVSRRTLPARSLSSLLTTRTLPTTRQPANYTNLEREILEREILRPDRAETCQSGTDDEVARHKSPYDPTLTSPEKEVSALREEYRLEGDLIHDPLAVSPANAQVSRILALEEERPIMAGWHPLGSVKGWTSKRREVLLRREPYAFRAYEAVFPYFRKKGKVCIP